MSARIRKVLIVLGVVVALALPLAVTLFMDRTTPVAPPGKPTGPTAISYGDGRAAEAHNLRLTDVRLPTTAGKTGTVRFDVLDQAAQPVARLIPDRGHPMHVYVVRDDYTVFRHLTPRSNDGTWSAPVTLPQPGRYRVIVEFTEDAGNHNDHIVVGTTDFVGGTTHAASNLGSRDRTVEGEISGGDKALASGVLALRLSSRTETPLRLAGISAVHVVAFHTPTRIMVRLHPYGVPQRDRDALVIPVRSTLRLEGPYMFFVEVETNGQRHLLRLDDTIG